MLLIFLGRTERNHHGEELEKSFHEAKGDPGGRFQACKGKGGEKVEAEKLDGHVVPGRVHFPVGATSDQGERGRRHEAELERQRPLAAAQPPQ